MALKNVTFTHINKRVLADGQVSSSPFIRFILRKPYSSVVETVTFDSMRVTNYNGFANNPFIQILSNSISGE